ncbi:MAG: hypothetical protein ACRDIV_01425 [Ktedonobacteraceae bacterium]
MPKKTASTRGGASRNKPKPQKNIQLVRPNADTTPAVNDNDRQDESSEEETSRATPTSKSTVASTATVSKAEVATTKKSEKKSEVESEPAPKANDDIDTSVANKGSAAARLAARRQNVLKQQVQRNTSLITSEHYAYVKRDLIYILILAVIMFSAIIVMHFIPAIGG